MTKLLTATRLCSRILDWIESCLGSLEIPSFSYRIYYASLLLLLCGIPRHYCLHNPTYATNDFSEGAVSTCVLLQAF